MIKAITEPMRFNINGYSIDAYSLKDVFEYLWYMKNEAIVVCKFEDGRQIGLQVQVEYNSCWLDDSMAIAVADKLKLMECEVCAFEVYTTDGQWLATSHR